MEEEILDIEFDPQKLMQTLFERVFRLEAKVQLIIDIMVDFTAEHNQRSKEEVKEELLQLAKEIGWDNMEKDPLLQAWRDKLDETNKKNLGL